MTTRCVWVGAERTECLRLAFELIFYSWKQWQVIVTRAYYELEVVRRLNRAVPWGSLTNESRTTGTFQSLKSIRRSLKHFWGDETNFYKFPEAPRAIRTFVSSLASPKDFYVAKSVFHHDRFPFRSQPRWTQVSSLARSGSKFQPKENRGLIWVRRL